VDPLSGIALGATVLSAGVGAAGAISSASAASSSAKYQAAVARNNQIIATQNAAREEQAGRVRAQNQDFKNRAVEGAIEAGQSAGGIDSSTGSPSEVRKSATQLGRLDTLTLMSNADQTVRASQIQATGFEGQAALDRAQASQATAAGGIGAFTSILGGASSFADKWLKYRDQGVQVFS
jgi:hypothetical protein